MGDKDETKKEASEQKLDDAGGAKMAAGDSITVILKLDLHCEGCAKKIKKSVRNLEGVESVKADTAGNKLTVTGRVNPTRVKERVESKTKKKVEIISPQPKKDGGGGGAEEKADDKPSEKNSDDKKPTEPQSMVLKIPLHCDGCIQKIKRIISKIDGVESVIPDANKDLVMVKGTMNMKELTTYLKEKLKRNVNITPPPKEDKDNKKKYGGGGNKKDGEAMAASGGGEKKDDEAKAVNGGGGEKRINSEEKAVNGGGEKKEDGKVKANDDGATVVSGGATVVNGGGGGGGDGSKSTEVVNKSEYYSHNPYTYIMPVYNQEISTSTDHNYVNKNYLNHAYVMDFSQAPPPPPPMYLNDPQAHDETGMFSDENPNGCFIM